MRNWARYSLRVYGAGYLMDYAPFDPISQEYRAAHKGVFRKIVTALCEGSAAARRPKFWPPPTPPTYPAQRKSQPQVPSASWPAQLAHRMEPRPLGDPRGL